VPGGVAAQGDFAREAEIVMTPSRGALAQIGLGMERIGGSNLEITVTARL
jgi:hypothetical protein